MRILQLIDTLQVGGAERMAVNFANSLAGEIEFSALVTSRDSGPLQHQLDKQVPFLCLQKKYILDWRAVSRLKKFCQVNQVQWIHAHGTSYFTAFLLKLTHPKIRILWHEHAGARSSENKMRNLVLLFCVRFFSGIIVVNSELELWCRKVLHFNRVIYLPNFTALNPNEKKTTTLQGHPGKRVVYLANLRHPKNHQLLLEVAVQLRQKHPDWTFHFIGQDKQDAYSDALKTSIKQNKLETTVYIYGLKEDTGHILDQASIAVIASSSEGLPVALLEYGLHEKAVVATKVGEIPGIISDGVNGLLVASNNRDDFFRALDRLISDPPLMDRFGQQLQQTIHKQHSETAVIKKYINWINQM